MSSLGACAPVGPSPDSYRHAWVATAQAAALQAKIVEIAQARPRFGYRRVHDLFCHYFPGVIHKYAYWRHTEANLTERKRKRVRRPHGSEATRLPSGQTTVPISPAQPSSAGLKDTVFDSS
jgi:putative transposase